MKIIAKRTLVVVVDKDQVTVSPGQQCDLPDDEAKRLIAKRHANRWHPPDIDSPPPIDPRQPPQEPPRSLGDMAGFGKGRAG